MPHLHEHGSILLRKSSRNRRKITYKITHEKKLLMMCATSACLFLFLTNYARAPSSTVTSCSSYQSRTLSIELNQVLDTDSLRNFLSCAYGDEGLIVLATANTGFSDMMRNFLCYYKTSGSQAIITFYTSDAELATLANEYGHVALLTNFLPNINLPLAYRTINYQILMHHRTQTVNDILDLGYRVLLADIDAVWLKDPIPFIQNNFTTDIAGQMDLEEFCGGFLYLNGKSEGVKALWKMVLKEHSHYLENSTDIADFTEQKIFNNLLRRNFSYLATLPLSDRLFPSGNDFFAGGLDTSEAIVVHNNWIVGLNEKIMRFKSRNLWKLGLNGECLVNGI